MQLTKENKRALVRLGLELVLYTVLVVVYLLLILRLFENELVVLFKSNPVLYALLALGLMVFQGLFLETVTTFLIDRLEL